MQRECQEQVCIARQLAGQVPAALTRAASFTASMAKFTAGGFRTVSHQTYQDRFAHCLPCPHYDLGLCTACGCWLDAKVRLPHEACPEGKWASEQEG